MAKILVIDDEAAICFAFEQFLKQKKHRPFIASNAEDGLRLFMDKQPDVVFLDIRLPGKSGLALLEKIKNLDTDCAVVIMTAYGTMDTAIQAMQQGAYDYLTKPIDLDRIETLLDRLLRPRTTGALFDLPNDGTLSDTSNTLIGSSRAIQDIYKLIGLLTTNDVTVLIEGESGVGKELVARAIHFRSERGTAPFVAINCGAMPENLLETELFGHEKGAFTGAENKKIGQFEYADNGTIFLDEIGELQLSLQIKLLRVLQENQFVRVGGLRPIHVQARVITATNKNLAEEVRMGNFRSDLYYRLQLITLKIPPLRERKTDIPELAAHFIKKGNRELGKRIMGIEEEAMRKLMNHNWPGNVRELENVIKRAAIMTRGDTLGAHALDALLHNERMEGLYLDAETVEKCVQLWLNQADASSFIHPGDIYRPLIAVIEKTLICEALKKCHDNQVKTAKLLGMNRSTLRKKIEEYNLYK